MRYPILIVAAFMVAAAGVTNGQTELKRPTPPPRATAPSTAERLKALEARADELAGRLAKIEEAAPAATPATPAAAPAAPPPAVAEPMPVPPVRETEDANDLGLIMAAAALVLSVAAVVFSWTRTRRALKEAGLL